MNINVIKKILIGSKYFFSQFPDYKSKDSDYILITNESDLSRGIRRFVPSKEEDCFLMPGYVSKKELLEYHRDKGSVMGCGKWLVPELSKYFNITLDDIKEYLDSKIRQIDELHLYEIFIYECYLKNGDMSLTDSQRKEAYKIYKSKR